MLLHTTELDEIPLCLAEFQGKLLVGAGKSLRLYELGKKKLLKKIENKTFPTNVVRIHTLGDRIFVGDMCESVHYVKYRRTENVLAIFADDTFPRSASCKHYCVLAVLY
jgi:splicing factor 3B subunit 3